jgi:hypothetical protein
MKIDVIDMADPVLGNDRVNLVQQYADPNDIMIKMYPMSNGIVQMVNDVYDAAQGSGSSIGILRIWGHGWSGGQLIAAGTDGQAGVDNASALWGSNLNDYANYLSNLAPFFNTSGAHVELKGCEVAKGTQGESFLVKLAVILNTPVQAGVAVQGGANSSLSYGYFWDGPVIQATPDYVVQTIH